MATRLEIFGNLQPDFLQFVLLCTEGTVENRRAVLGVGVSMWIMVRSNRGLVIGWEEWDWERDVISGEHDCLSSGG